MPVQLQCNYCNNKYSVIPSRAEKSKFCSMECKSSYQSKEFNGSDNPNYSGGHKTDYTCGFCGEVFEGRIDKERKFCSEHCKAEHQSEKLVGENNPNYSGGDVILTCSYCDKEYFVKPAKSDNSRFCSRNCMALWRSENKSGKNSWNWNGGVEKEYGPLWNRIRGEVRKRDEVCQICSMSISEHVEKYNRKPDVHHIKPIKQCESFKKANDKSNLIMLCRSCHMKVERGGKDLNTLETNNEP